MDIEKWCRICSIEVKCGVFLFSEEAKRAFLHAKIRKYLSVSVRTIFVFTYGIWKPTYFYYLLQISLEDKLPKMICEDCVLKIDGFHSFATMALKNQEKLTRCVLSTPVSPEPTKTDNVSLLHTYLTKVSHIFIHVIFSLLFLYYACMIPIIRPHVNYLIIMVYILLTH